MDYTLEEKNALDSIFPAEEVAVVEGTDTLEQEVIEEVTEEVAPVTEELTTDEVVEPIVEEEVVTDDDEIRIGAKPEVVAPVVEEPVVEKKVELKKSQRPIPFKNDTQKTMYNYMAQEDNADVNEFMFLYGEQYSKMSDQEVIRKSIVMEQGDDLDSNVLNRLVDRKLNSIKGDLDLDDDVDLDIYNKMIQHEAKKIRGEFDKKRNGIIEKYSNDAVIDFEEEVEIPLEETEEQYNERLNKVVSEIGHNFKDVVTVIDKDGPIAIPAISKTQYAEAILNPTAFISKHVVDKDGKMDYEKLARVVNYIANADVHDSTIIKQGIAIGKKSLTKQIKNTSEIKSREAELGKNEGLFDSTESLIKGILASATQNKIN